MKDPPAAGPANAGPAAAVPGPVRPAASTQPPSGHEPSGQQPSGQQPSGQAPDRGNGKLLAVVLVGSFMAVLDTTIVNVALPSIAAGTHASSAGLEWVVSGYALAFGLALVPAGRIGDRFGNSRSSCACRARSAPTGPPRTPRRRQRPHRCLSGRGRAEHRPSGTSHLEGTCLGS